MINENEYLNIINLLGENLEKLYNKSLLITGATGLIGSYLINFLHYINATLNYDMKISIITRSKNNAETKFKNYDIDIIEQDLNTNFTLDKNFDFILHLASNSHPVAFSLDPVGTMKSNLLGTINLLDGIINTNKNAKFIFVSSGEIYGNNTDKPFSENDFGCIDSKAVRSCYPESKRAAETLCMAYKHQYKINVNVIRLCYVYGSTITKENSRADAQFLRNALNGEDIILKSKGLQKRTYCYVADAVSAILHILINNFNGEFFNIANPDSIASVKDYAEILAKIANISIKFEMPNEIEEQGFSKQADSILDSSKLIKTNWKPLYDLEAGLRAAYNNAKDVVNVK